MNEKFTKNLSEIIGRGISITENKKSVKKKEESFFLDLIEILQGIDNNSIVAAELGINLIMYEELHLKAIELLLDQQYGETKTDLIMWWVFESTTEDGSNFIIVDEFGKEHTIKTPLQLFKFINKI
jgi:hypothetical protein